jgi:hypothetical protein
MHVDGSETGFGLYMISLNGCISEAHLKRGREGMSNGVVVLAFIPEFMYFGAPLYVDPRVKPFVFSLCSPPQ